MSAPVRRLVISSAIEPAEAAFPTGAAGRLTLRLSGVLVLIVPRQPGTGWESRRPFPSCVTATPLVLLVPTGLGPVLLALCAIGRATLPMRTPRFFEKVVVRFDDSGLDQHLLHRDIDLAQQLAHFLESNGDVLHEHLVGAKIDRGCAALGQDALLRIGKELRERVGLGIVELEGLGAQRLELRDLSSSTRAPASPSSRARRAARSRSRCRSCACRGRGSGE